jgi:hypothetical protein
MGFPLPVGQVTTATFLESDSTFNPFPVQGPITWLLSVDGIASVVVAGDTKSATLTGVAAGDVTLTASGDGVEATIDLTVTDHAVAASISLSTPATPAA